ncbi:MAG: Accessory gene regulator protein B [Candidatus Dichloromethanomonas elyunquensis]|nr:MAG: Accessory gene regulator protein B [Candidatus Dichloromethanomonas elyunquensis]
MINLSEISQHLSDTITRELNYTDEKREIVAYGLESLFLSIIGFLAILLVAFSFNALIPTVIAAGFGGLLRKTSGGAHMNTPLKCLTFGAIIYSILGVISQLIVKYHFYDFKISLIIMVICLMTVTYLAPVDCESKPIISPKLRRNLKFISISFVILSFFIVLLNNNVLINTSVVLGISYQTLTLLPVFNIKKKKEDYS